MAVISQRAAYLIEVGTWFIPFGMQIVLFPWFVTVVLQGSGSQLGLVQASINLPLILLPLTGLLAERLDRRALIFWGHIGAVFPPLLLIYALQGEALHYGILVMTGLGYGLMSALSMPARESMLVSVAGGEMQRTVTMATATQFGVQALGYLIAGQVERLTPEVVLSLQAAVLAVGAVVTRFGLPANAPQPDKPKISIAETFNRLRGTPVPAVMVLNASLGLLYLSSFSVLIPLLLRERLDSSASSISYAFIGFMFGVVAVNILQSRLPKTRRLGIQAILAPLAGAVVMVLMTGVPNLPVMVLLMFFWGNGASVTLVSARTLLMLNTSEEIRGRTMAIYQLAFLGTVPLGSAVMGQLADLLSVNIAMLICVGTMIVILSGLVLFTNLWQATDEGAPPAAPLKAAL